MYIFKYNTKNLWITFLIKRNNKIFIKKFLKF